MKIIISESQFKKLFLIKEEKIILNELEYIKFKTENESLSPGLVQLLVYVAGFFKKEIIVEVTENIENEIKVYIPEKDKKILDLINEVKDNSPLYTFRVSNFKEENGEKGVTITSNRNRT